MIAGQSILVNEARWAFGLSRGFAPVRAEMFQEPVHSFPELLAHGDHDATDDDGKQFCLRLLAFDCILASLSR